MSQSLRQKCLGFSLILNLCGGLSLAAEPADIQKKCGALSAQIKAASKNTPDTSRMMELQDLKSLIKELKNSKIESSKIPKSYWQTCLNKSIELLRAYTESSSSGLRLRPEYLLLISELYETQENLPQALSFMDESIRVSPKDPALRIRGVRLWLALEEKKARELPTKSRGTPGQATLMKNRMDSFLRPIIDDTHSEMSARIAALDIRSTFFEKTGNLESAYSDWKTLAQLDPKNIACWRKIAAYESSLGSPQKATQALNQILAVDPTDLAAHKSLVRIYTDQKDYRSAKNQSRLALKYHPKDPELEGILRLDGGKN